MQSIWLKFSAWILKLKKIKYLPQTHKFMHKIITDVLKCRIMYNILCKLSLAIICIFKLKSHTLDCCSKHSSRIVYTQPKWMCCKTDIGWLPIRNEQFLWDATRHLIRCTNAIRFNFKSALILKTSKNMIKLFGWFEFGFGYRLLNLVENTLKLNKLHLQIEYGFWFCRWMPQVRDKHQLSNIKHDRFAAHLSRASIQLK